MKLSSQKRLAAQILGVGETRVSFDNSKLPEIKEAITKADIRSLISKGFIKSKPVKSVSRFRARKLKSQKRKGRRSGIGSRKGTPASRLPKKRRWISKVRVQRSFIKELKNKKKVTLATYRKSYKMIKGNFFRSKRHIKLYLEEHNLFKK